ncbi:MAG TPA: hypothetical protein VNH53_03710 [Sphingomicrobium sp.]|jgi:hypothetical protein|nr:hypothetical protein [Sphingomicrobium sp.]
MSSARSWLRRQARACAGSSLFWLMTLGAMSAAAIAAICLYAIRKGISAEAASLLGTAVGLLGYALRDTIGAIRVILGAPDPAPRDDNQGE